ncbi:hypothetical protein B0H19DRAFT_1083192 [Mycena capillaripes]|nr:hypothetical protein B0H19DRAFT_1083192 [Mycena capillaripes]
MNRDGGSEKAERERMNRKWEKEVSGAERAHRCCCKPEEFGVVYLIAQGRRKQFVGRKRKLVACLNSCVLFVSDFHGTSFNLANSVYLIILASGAVSGRALSEQVNLIPVNAAKTEFILRFPLPQPVDVLWANNNPASLLKFAQTFAQPGGGIFELVCSGTSPANILEVSNGLALTAWETQPGSSFWPV